MIENVEASYETVSDRIRIKIDRNGFSLEFLLDGRWTPGVTYDKLSQARDAANRLRQRHNFPHLRVIGK